MIHVLFCFSVNLILTRTCYVLVIYVSSTCHSPRDGIFGVVNFVVSKPFYCNVKIPLRLIKKHNKTPYNDKKNPPNNPNKQTPQQNKKIPKNKTNSSSLGGWGYLRWFFKKENEITFNKIKQIPDGKKGESCMFVSVECVNNLLAWYDFPPKLYPPPPPFEIFFWSTPMPKIKQKTTVKWQSMMITKGSIIITW